MAWVHPDWVAACVKNRRRVSKATWSTRDSIAAALGSAEQASAESSYTTWRAGRDGKPAGIVQLSGRRATELVGAASSVNSAAVVPPAASEDALIHSVSSSDEDVNDKLLEWLDVIDPPA